MVVDNFSKDDNLIELQTTSQYNPVIDTNISFYESDRGTGVLNFAVTKNNKPLSISKHNAMTSIVLKTDNFDDEHGAYISDDLTIVDAINGRMQYVIPNEFLKYTGRVHAQAYFTQNGSNNVIVERQFSFNIENDLISNFDGKTKLVYIKSIQDLTESVKEEVEDLKKSLNDTKSLVSEIDSRINQGIQRLEIKQNEAVQMITTTQDKAVQYINSEFQKIVDKEQAIYKRVSEVEKQISGADLVKGNSTVNWQKSKITDDYGKAIESSEQSIDSVLSAVNTSRIIHITSATDAPSFEDIGTVDTPKEDGVDDGSDVPVAPNTLGKSGVLVVYVVDDSTARATWYPDDSNDEYTKYKIGGTWYPFYKKNDGDLTKQFVEETSNNALNQAKQYVDDKFGTTSWQQHKMTEANGQSIQVNLNNAQGDLGYLTAGNYYATRVPDLPSGVESYEGYLSVFVKDETNKLFNFTPYNSKKIYTRSITNGRLEPQWTVPNEHKSTVLFDGGANGVGTTINLTEPYTNYSILLVSGTYPGGIIEGFGLTALPNAIQLSKANVVDSDGNGGGIYECLLSKTSSTTLRIDNDVYFDLGKTSGSGANANKVTITKIMGWK
ncbi:TPA: BppU family phage baseplate upper protein [Staphylococcus aureus]|uniref:BppU family phage baseplate upper protein n=1 Tax=Staphylococcus aureus TaxID=1280 RepID=UPI0008A8FCC7|nr:BppU family phage baseplate upper protein [Staphylococcus aureus]MCT6562599.1 BppU family phage baseplate upper protein [Staphylococcus aureus]MDN8680001.1 BppU family phage baseplate upper protein [Staphylococcus aureus]MDN8699060.1 BppU family phage baseplate upper protein [Staphylococcus aureus]MDN8750744.1 BppU family phage baseplate upper protein [Staphylococcus aureus]MDO8259842.1 BppU family phage baseplate upper protein [Staphylococcus aureus]